MFGMNFFSRLLNILASTDYSSEVVSNKSYRVDFKMFFFFHDLPIFSPRALINVFREIMFFVKNMEIKNT